MKKNQSSYLLNMPKGEYEAAVTLAWKRRMSFGELVRLLIRAEMKNNACKRRQVIV